jgi:squalene-associated FAD-dependent desaturase
MHVRIIGAGWAGLSAAVAASLRGWQVTLIEASRQPGGRAKRVDTHEPTAVLDNGQHILIGAYRDTLALMHTVGCDVPSALLRLPLDLRDTQGDGLHLPGLPNPWHVLTGIAKAKGWRWCDKLSLLRAAARWQWSSFQCPLDWTVQQLCDQHHVSLVIQRSLIEPLCLSALNTAINEASAQVFLRVLRDALLSGAGSSDLLLPRQELSQLLPEPAIAWLTARGADVRCSQTVDAESLQAWVRDAKPQTPVVLATSFRQAAKLTSNLSPAWAAIAQGLSPRAIATVYLRVQDAAHEASYRGLPRPMMALTDGPAQFVFCRTQLLPSANEDNAMPILAAVVSDCRLDREILSERVAEQLSTHLGIAHLEVIQTVVEKQATFACTPDLNRPSSRIPTADKRPVLWACGDYVDGPYPATLEGAVRSGAEVIAQIGEVGKA